MVMHCLFKYEKRRVFIVGFVIGVALALIFRRVENLALRGSCLLRKGELPNYNDWFASKGLTRKLMDYDSHIYGQENGITEASYLKKKIPIVCVVFVKQFKNAAAIKHTWGKHCNSIEFIGSHNLENNDENYAIPLAIFKPRNSFHLLCDSINYILKKHQDIEWALFTYDYLYVIVENLRYFVAPFDPNIPYYFGHPQVFWGQVYNFAEAGYVLSRAALNSIHEKFNSTILCQKGGKYWKNEDYYLGKHLADMGIFPEDTRMKGRNRFHGSTFRQLLFPDHPSETSSTWKKSIHPYVKGFNCCSNKSITFHGMSADALYFWNYFVQNLKVFNSPARFGSVRALSDEQVWKQFLKSKGLKNMNISAEEYYNLWLKEISAPYAFNEHMRKEHSKVFEITGADFVNMPHVLESMLHSMHVNENITN